MNIKYCENPEHYLVGQVLAEIRSAESGSERRIAIALRDYFADQIERKAARGQADLALLDRNDMEQMNAAIQRLTKGAQ